METKFAGQKSEFWQFWIFFKRLILAHFWCLKWEKNELFYPKLPKDSRYVKILDQMKGKDGKKITLNKLFFLNLGNEDDIQVFPFWIIDQLVLVWIYLVYYFQPFSTSGTKVIEKTEKKNGNKIEVNQACQSQQTQYTIVISMAKLIYF